MDEETIDVSATVAQARRAMTGNEYRRKFRKADFITYSPKQMEILNSHASALFVRAGNQVGKTEVGAGLVKALITQEYPADYEGPTQPKLDLARPHSCEVWCVSPTMQMSREACQSRLLGDVGAGLAGTGVIPAERIISIANARGISGAVDSCVIRRADGTTGVIRFKSAEAGREAMQGSSVDLVWVDEMVDMEILSELLARLAATSGRLLLTATPLRQQSDVFHWFAEPGHPERQTIVMGIGDASHLTDAMREQMIARFANDPTTAATRLHGALWSGGGLVFPSLGANNLESIDPYSLSPGIRWIIGADPSHQGISPTAHPSAAVLVAFDPFSKVYHVVDELRLKNALLSTFAATILKWDFGDAPCAYGAAETQGAGGDSAKSYAQMLKEYGLRMLGTHATLPGGGVSLDAQLDFLVQLLAEGRLRINRRCRMLIEEMSQYERDDNGKPIALRDDLIASLRYACLMAAQHARGLNADRVRGGLGRRRQFPSMAEGVDFDVHGNTAGDLPVGRQRGRSGPYMARDADFDPLDV